jgi:signal transduction histidine kinase
MVCAFAVSFPLENLGVILGVHRKIIFTFALIDGLFIVLFGGWLIGRVAIVPLVRIARGAESFAAGDYDVRVEEKGAREIVTVAASFNLMADRVQEAVRDQEKHLEALEAANRELRAAQAEMVRVEKLASVGRLSAGIAHEIGNPLSAILGYSSILLKEEEDEEKAGHLRYIEKETERIQRIIGELLEFARPREVRVDLAEMNELVEDTLDLVKPQKDMAGITVKISLAEDLPGVMVDRYQLQQAVINVVINGAQAMEGNGELYITTMTREIAADEKDLPKKRATDGAGADYAAMRRGPGEPVLLSAGDRVVSVIVEDTGPGIEPHILEKVFDPFYTTKDPGSGTGLGLSITYGIVEAHGGRMHIRNRREGGVRVTIDIPIASQPE